MNTTHFGIFFITIGLVSACGFHLKGHNNSAHILPTLHLNCDCSPSLRHALAEAFMRHNININDNNEQALTLTIDNDHEASSDTAMGDHDRTKEVQLTHRFDAQIERHGELLGKQSISSSAFMRYNSDTYLGSNNEANETMRQLYRENTTKLIEFITHITDR